MQNWLDQLSERQRSVVEKRYGLSGSEIHTLVGPAQDLHLTRERVRQIQLEALSGLRRILQRSGINRHALF